MIDALLARGYDVTSVDLNWMMRRDDDIPQTHFHIVMDARQFFKHFYDKYDVVVHLAAIVGGRKKIEGDPLAVAADLAIDSDFFQWAVRTQQKHVIYYSSSAAYPVELQTEAMLNYVHEKGRVIGLEERDIDIHDVRSPDLTYGWVKLTGEILAHYAAEKGVHCHILRPFSGYGEDQALDYPFPSFIERAFRGDMPFQVWGDGRQVRDFIHIDDVVEGTLRAFELDIIEPLNLGTGVATSFNDLAKMCMSANPAMYPHGVDYRIEHMHAEPVGVMYRVANVERMNVVYTPHITLEQGIERAMRAMHDARRG